MQYRYEQIAGILENKIRSGEWQIGQKIPGELALAGEFHVGRSTIRETLNILQQKGMVDKRHGSGTYVKENKQKMENPIMFLSSIGQMIENAGYEAGSIFYSVTHETPDLVVSERLGLSQQDRIVVMNRERTANGVPVVFSYNIFPEKLVGDIFDEGLKGSIFQLLRDKCGVTIAGADTFIKGVNPNNAWDELALVYLKEPVVLLEQLHVNDEGIPVLFSYDYIRTDIMNLHLRRKM
ncbi:GntR family transcriptional regulator [Hungatella hathewayi]|uniref:GntR family transcriptional regulator n=1 Tax=Hungatella hathewayi TaxID=154046 RepID=UPI00356B5D3C